MFTSSVNWADVIQMLILPIVLPAVVGLVSKSTWPTLAKRLTLGGLTLATTILTAVGEYLVTATPIDIGSIFLQWLLTWGLGELTYYGIFKAPVVAGHSDAVEAPKDEIEVESYTKPQLLSLAEQVTGVLPDSKLTKSQIAKVIDDATPPVYDITYTPPVTIAGWLAQRGNKAA